MSDGLKEFFSEEAMEIFASVESILMKAEENVSLSEEEIGALFRDMHTLKGSSNAVGFEYFSKYVHYLETFMENIRNGSQKISKKVIEFIIDSSDTMQSIFDDEFKNQLDTKQFDIELENLLKNIDSLKESSDNDTNNEVKQEQPSTKPKLKPKLRVR